MWNLQLRIGIAELVFACSLAFLAALAVLFVIEWPVALVPAVTYALASVAAHAGYRIHAGEQARVAETERAVTFRVIETRGACPVGRQRGDLVSVTGGRVTPFVCQEAQAVLKIASASPDSAQEWCCPLYEHLLVFKREKLAA
jgi:hypothetical protein